MSERPRDVPVKHPYRGRRRWALWVWEDIPDATEPQWVYLRRLRVLMTPWRSIYLHWIYRPDHDRDPHNHPMAFWSMVLRGGYVERRWHADPQRGTKTALGARLRRRLTIAKTGTGTAHMIEELRPDTVTLLLVGRRVQDWGFFTDEEYVPWEPYVAAKEQSVLASTSRLLSR